MIVIRNLKHLSREELYEAFNDAFGNYERTWTPQEFDRMLTRDRYDPEISIGAFSDQKLVSFIFFAGGIFDGKPTAYDTGTGTIKSFQGQGLSGELFRAVIPELKLRHYDQCLLEVLQYNKKALSVYTKLGFTIRREFNYYRGSADALLPDRSEPELGLQLTDSPDWEMYATLCDMEHAWQNSSASVSSILPELHIVEAFHESEFVGFGITEPETGDIPQLAVRKEYRRKGFGRRIFNHLASMSKNGKVKVINIDTSVDALDPFIRSTGLPLSGSQYEMILDLKNTPWN